MALCTMLISAFLFGSIVGAIGYDLFGYRMLYLPAISTGAVGVAYAIYHHRRQTPN
jgi:hypothetical protein